jgi:hypothetical protein
MSDELLRAHARYVEAENDVTRLLSAVQALELELARLREIEKAARILVKGKSAERYVPLKRALGYWPDVDE